MRSRAPAGVCAAAGRLPVCKRMFAASAKLVRVRRGAACRALRPCISFDRPVPTAPVKRSYRAFRRHYRADVCSAKAGESERPIVSSSASSRVSCAVWPSFQGTLCCAEHARAHSHARRGPRLSAGASSATRTRAHRIPIIVPRSGAPPRLSSLASGRDQSALPVREHRWCVPPPFPWRILRRAPPRGRNCSAG